MSIQDNYYSGLRGMSMSAELEAQGQGEEEMRAAARLDDARLLDCAREFRFKVAWIETTALELLLTEGGRWELGILQGFPVGTRICAVIDDGSSQFRNCSPARIGLVLTHPDFLVAEHNSPPAYQSLHVTAVQEGGTVAAFGYAERIEPPADPDPEPTDVRGKLNRMFGI